MEDLNGATADELVAERKAARAQASEQEQPVIEPVSDEADEQAAIEADDGQEISDSPLSDDVEEQAELDNPDDAEEQDEAEEQPLIDPPHFWDAEGKKHFADLDPVTQQFVLAQDKNAQAAATRAIEDAKVKARQEVTTVFQDKLTQLEAAIMASEQKLSEEYATDAQLAEWVRNGQIDANQALAHQLERNAKAEELAKSKQTATQQQQAFISENIKTRQAKLSETMPELLKPETARKVVTYIQKNGKADLLDYADATDLTMAYKAMLYDEGKASLKNRPKPKPKAPTRGLKPALKQSAPNPNKKLQTLEKRASESGSMEDILALRKAKRELKTA